MNSPTPPATDPLPGVVDWIEQHLDQPLTLEAVAAQAGLSPYHFSRLFTARMGRSVMAHVRGRRLVSGARRLCDEPELKLVDLAFDCGFESQEAFTRAFKRVFGVSPGRFRSGFAVNPIEGQYPMTAPAPHTSSVVLLPDRVHLPAFHVAGPARRFDEATRGDIPQLWSALIGALPIQGQVKGGTTYGIVCSVDAAEGSFQYMAGVGVEPGCKPPPGFSTMEVAGARYAVFRITLNGAALQPQVRQAMAAIWGDLLPASGLKLAAGPDFERYGGDFDPLKPGACIDFHVPVDD
jgi:AraC family transcriptional regulator